MRTAWRNLWLPSILTCLLLLGLTPQLASPQQLFPLRVGAITLDAVDTIGPYAALKEGYYQQEGINPILSLSPNGPVTLQRMAAGDIDATWSTAIVPFFQAVTAGVDLVWVTSTIKGNFPVLVRPDIKNAKGLDGKRVGTPGIGTIYDTVLTIYEKKQGITTKHVYGRINDLVTYMEKGEIDGMVPWYPPAEQAHQKFGAVYLTLSVMPEASSGGIIFPRAFAQKHPEVVKRFIRANLRGITYFQKNPQAFADWVAGRDGLEPGLARAILLERQNMPWYGPETNKEATKTLIRETRDAGKIPREKVPDDAAIEALMASRIDESFLRAVIKEMDWKQ